VRVIDISGRTALVTTVNGCDSCCRTQTVQVPLKKGKNANHTDHAPSIDEIAVSRPQRRPA
jgi:hypothetical protein